MINIFFATKDTVDLNISHFTCNTNHFVYNELYIFAVFTDARREVRLHRSVMSHDRNGRVKDKAVRHEYSNRFVQIVF